MFSFNPFLYKHSESPTLRSCSPKGNNNSGSIFTPLDTDEKCTFLSSQSKAGSALRHGGMKHLTTNTIMQTQRGVNTHWREFYSSIRTAGGRIKEPRICPSDISQGTSEKRMTPYDYFMKKLKWKFRVVLFCFLEGGERCSDEEHQSYNKQKSMLHAALKLFLEPLGFFFFFPICSWNTTSSTNKETTPKE